MTSLTLTTRCIISAAIFLSVCIGTANAACHEWNGCKRRVAKHLAEFRQLSAHYIDASQKCVDALNQLKSKSALNTTSECRDSGRYKKSIDDILDDGDVMNQLTDDDAALWHRINNYSFDIEALASRYETPAEREADVEKSLDATYAEEQKEERSERRDSSSSFWRAVVNGVATAPPLQPPTIRPPVLTTCQAVPFGNGVSCMTLGGVQANPSPRAPTIQTPALTTCQYVPGVGAVNCMTQ